jgi:integrase
MPKLSQSVVKALTCLPSDSQKFYMDDELTGFCVSVSPTKKVFYLKMRIGHKVVKRRIGEYGVHSVDQARKTALQIKAQLLSGGDPYAEKLKSVTSGTLEDLFTEYAKDVEHKESTRRSIQHAKKKFDDLSGKAFRTKPNIRTNEVIDLIPVQLSSWLKRRYRDITQDEILARFDTLSRMVPTRKLHEKPVPITRTANQTFKFLQAAYNYIIRKHGLTKLGFDNPVDILKTTRRWSRINRRKSFLDTQKPYFVQWWHACEAEPAIVIGDYILFTLLQAGRSMECATLRWDDVDVKQGEVTYRDTKNRLDYTFPLTPLAIKILDKRRKERVNDFVFGYADSKTGHVPCPPQQSIKRIRKACGEHWTMHDLRRTFTTTMTSLNVHAFTIAHLMKHSPTITMTLSYAPPTREQLLDALLRFEQCLSERVNPAANNRVGICDIVYF